MPSPLSSPHSPSLDRPAPSAPLLVTSDPGLLDEVLRLAAGAGVTLDVAHDAQAALRSWTTASLVLVAADLAPAVALLRPPRRIDVLVVTENADESTFRHAVTIGASDVLELAAAEGWLVEVLADVADGGRPLAMTVGFVGGSGGAGTTTSVAAVGLAAAEAGIDTVLVDLDPLGSGAERVLGLERGDGIRWADLAGSSGRLGSRALRDSLPAVRGLRVLGFGAAVGASPDESSAREVLSAAQRGHDVVLVDLPRHLDSAAAAVATRCDRLVLVARASLAGAASAARVEAQLSELGPSVAVIARTGSGTVTADQLAEALGLPLLAEFVDSRRVTEHVDLGLGPSHASRGPVARAARLALSRLRPIGSAA